jgi:hypothetical protein
MPGPTDRAVIVGKTGSGKTTFAETVCAVRPFVVVLDSKGTINWRGYTVVKTLHHAMKLRTTDYPRIIYRPGPRELMDAGLVDKFFEWCYLRGHCAVYVDEVLSIATATTYPFWMAAILTRGRELGTVLYASTQRPYRCPRIIFSEAEHAYCFRLSLAQDRQRIEDDCSIPTEYQDQLSKYQFLYARQDDEPRGPFRLDLAS